MKKLLLVVLNSLALVLNINNLKCETPQPKRFALNAMNMERKIAAEAAEADGATNLF